MVNRVNDWPIRLFSGRVVETSANTFTQIRVRLAHNAIPVEGKLQGMEICKIISSVLPPDAEAGETNQTTTQITNVSSTQFLGINKERTIWERRVSVGSAGATAAQSHERTKIDDIMCDGKGMIVWDREVFAAVFGVGNSNTKILEFAAFGYLVEGNVLAVVGQMN